MKRKGWIIFILVVLIASQLAIFPTFHEVNVSGMTVGTSAVSILKYNYVSATIHVSIGLVQNNSVIIPVFLTFYNGTTIQLTSDLSFTLKLSGTGNFLGNGAKLVYDITPQHPLYAFIVNNITSVKEYFSFLPTSVQGNNVDVYAFAINGSCLVSLSAYGEGI